MADISSIDFEDNFTNEYRPKEEGVKISTSMVSLQEVYGYCTVMCCQ